MPEDITVSVAEVLEIVKNNRDNHRAKFLKAQEGYRARVITELDKRLADARAGRRIDLFLNLPEPEDHTSDYDQEIRMLEMHTKDEVTVDRALFRQYVMDDWRWSRSFAQTNATYGVS